MEPLFDELVSGEKIPFTLTKNLPTKPGIYLLSEGGEDLYVGRTSRNLRNRMKGHGSGTHFSSTFAFLLARHETGIEATYKPKGSREDLMSDPVFRPAFDRALERIKKMEVRHIVIEDDHVQHVFELYTALRLNTRHNHFRTS